jgi:hypothetical protein
MTQSEMKQRETKQNIVGKKQSETVMDQNRKFKWVRRLVPGP